MRRSLPLALAALLALFFGVAIVGDRTIYTGDTRAFAGARDRLLVESFAKGEGVPSWAPGIAGGAPVLAAQELGLLYPPSILLALGAGERAVPIWLALHFALGAAGAFALARRLGASEHAAALAAAAFMFGGAVLSAYVTPMYVGSAAWTCWASAGLLRAAARERGGLALATASFLGIFLGGDPHGCVLAAVAALAIAVAHDGPSRRRVPLFLAAAAILTALLGAAQLAPALAVFDQTARVKGLDWETASRWSFWPPEALGLVVPYAFGDHFHPGSVWIDAVSPDHERAWAEAYYVGPIVLALAACGVARVRESSLARAGVLLVVLFAPFALGKFGFVHRLVYDLVPGGKLFRYPAKLMVLPMLGVALLAAAGLDDPRRRRALLAALGVALAGALVGLAWVHLDRNDLALSIDAHGVTRVDGAAALAALEPRLAHVALFALGALVLSATGRPRARSGLVALALLDIALALRGGVYLAPREPFELAPRVAPVLEALAREDGAPARVVGSPSARAVRPEDTQACAAPADGDLAKAEGLLPDWGLGRGVLDQEGFLANPPLRRETLREATKALPLVDRTIRSGARYLLVAGEDLGAEGVVVRTLDSRALVRLVRAPAWAALYGTVKYVPRRVPAALAVAAPAFDPRAVAVIESDPAPTDPGATGTAKLVGELGAHAFELEVTASGPAWLVVREAWARGWTAELDGTSVAVVPADVLFRAVLVPAGTHRVAFRFEAPRAREGALVSAASAVALAVLAALVRRRKG